MAMSSPSKLRLPHASAGPFWSPPPLEPRNEWRDIEDILSAPYDDERPHPRRGIPSFVFVAAALVLGSGMLASTLIGSRNECGADCRVVTAAGPTGEAPHPVATAGLAPRADTPVTEGRSVAEPAPAASPAEGAPAVPPVKHHHHRRHHSAVEF